MPHESLKREEYNQSRWIITCRIGIYFFKRSMDMRSGVVFHRNHSVRLWCLLLCEWVFYKDISEHLVSWVQKPDCNQAEVVGEKWHNNWTSFFSLMEEKLNFTAHTIFYQLLLTHERVFLKSDMCYKDMVPVELHHADTFRKACSI